ncbi:MAG: hypothetical protein GY820_38920 [Gammaproteobacteria bacterium]|nr:hypothetical protein [Gammaproteobacteria bacterium]
MIAYIVNLKNKGTTQRRLDFNSMCKFGGMWLFADGTNGLCELGGSDDNDSDIDAYFEPVTADFGIPNPKRGRFIHVGFETDGELEVDITFDGKTTETISLVPQNDKTGQQRISKEITRAGQGRYMTMQIRNVDGCDFSIDSVDIDMYILPQRIQDY